MTDDENEIIWPTEYHFNGERLDFATTVKQPIEIWYSAERNRSRIDFYGGTTKKFYYGGEEQKLYTIDPRVESAFTTSDIVCVIKSRKKEQEDFLPEVDDLTYTGKTAIIFDKVVDVWTGVAPDEDGNVKETTLYIYKTDAGVDIPVQWVVKSFKIVAGELVSQVIFNYYNFRDTVTDEELTVPNEEDCFYEGQLGQNFKSDIKMLHPDVSGDIDIAFDSYISHHDKAYREKEIATRKRIFENNWRMVHEHNRKNMSYKLELNEFSDKTPQELKYLRGTFVAENPFPAEPFPHTLDEINDIVGQLPKNFDLRMEGIVTGVKNQGPCGSCWAFATTAAMEGALARVNGDRLMDLSEQSLVDCAWRFDNLGCEGGTLDGALKYVLECGIPSEMEYGVYMAQNGICSINNMTDAHKITGFVQVTPRNPEALKVALFKYGPVTAAIHASDTMAQYSSGVFYDFTCEGESPNHAITVVGYGVHDSEEYWLIKNSWGERWGEGGYVLLSAKNNNCLLLDTLYYPVV